MVEQKRIDIDSIVYDEEKMSIWLSEVGNRIRMERIRQKMSISRLAELANLSVSCISKTESNQCGISLKALLKIADALNIPIWQLLVQEEAEDRTGIDQKLSDRAAQFEQITAESDEKTVAFILDMAQQLMKIMNQENDIKGEQEK